ncbi:hypothetical protein HPB48_014443 [Haemaphysalis longicornis]|uniref:CCHC-type domain-containing protein n=1 Tax=Haemaphysalis longicornis TaxID=44386 RepID=A0A9J6GRQ8_HAELO|nr:hypothetical protein HPB48_014443 [Haemaphysalis longicornis]
MLGASSSVVITFEGLHVPFYVKAYGILTRCRPYRQTIQCCSVCGQLGHRQDVCPNPDTPVCAQCHVKNPAADHECVPTCKLCGLDHPTASRDCRKKLRPPPPPIRVRERGLTSHATIGYSSTHQQRQAPRTAQPLRPVSPHVSWSAVAAVPPTASDQFPPLPACTKSPPTPPIDPQYCKLEQENAQLRGRKH